MRNGNNLVCETLLGLRITTTLFCSNLAHNSASYTCHPLPKTSI